MMAIGVAATEGVFVDVTLAALYLPLVVGEDGIMDLLWRDIL